MLVRALIAASAVLIVGAIRGGVLEAQTLEPGSATATATATATAGASRQTTPIAATVTSLPATPVAETATPLPESGQPMALVGYVIEDADGNGVRSAGDRGAQTLALVLVVSEGYLDGGAMLLTDEAGRFEFDDLLPGDYEFTVWWSPGYASIQGTPVVDDLLYGRDAYYSGILKLKVSVTGDGVKTYSYGVRESVGATARIRDAENAPPIPSGDLVILVKPNTEGVLPYPVSTGDGGGPVPVGKVSLRQLSMPSSGGGGGGAGVGIGWWLTGIGAILLAGTTVFLYVERRARGGAG
jgi:hypothetical protein